MKTKDVRRSVHFGQGGRAPGDAPSLGRVARMPGTGLPRGGRRKKRSSKNASARESRQKVVQAWSLIVCGLAVVCMGIAIFLWLAPQMRSGQNSVEENSIHTEQVLRVVSKFPSPSEEQSIAFVEEALSIRESEKVGDFFRLGAASPEEAVDFLAKMESANGAIERCAWLSSMDANGLSIDGVLVSFKGVERRLSRLALLTPDEAGKWKVDYEAFVRRVKPSWNEILKKGTDLAQVRIYVTKDSYYNGAFMDDQQWICYRIVSPDTEEILFGYCRVGSRQAAALNWMFSKEENVARATLEIRQVEGAESRQFEITKVLAEDWVLSEVPFDQGFNEF